MAQQAYAYVTLVPVATGFQAGISKELNGLGGIGQEAGSAISGGVGAGLKGIGPALAGAFAIGAIKNFTDNLITAGEAEQTSNARIEQIAKSMGIFGTESGTVAKRLQDLATAQQLNLGIDDDVIKSTQAKLLTFKELALTADESGGAFDRATQAAMDMASAGFGDATNNAVQLGKALNDPVKGITALARSGVTFTEQEKAKIEALVESGKMLEAQDMVLKAIETQVGGTAEATATASAKMDQAFAVVSEGIGLLLLPAFTAIATVITESIVPAVNGFVQFLADNPWAQTLAVALTAVVVALGLLAIGYAIWTSAIIANTIALLANPVVLIVMGVVALTAAIIYLATQTTFFQDTWTAMVGFVTEAWNATVAFFEETFNNIGQWFGDLWKGATDTWTGFVSFITTAVGAVGDFFKGVFKGVSDFIGSTFAGLVSIIKSPLNAIIAMVNQVIDSLNRISIDIPDWVPGFGGETFGFDIDRLTPLAKGGFVDSPTQALIGEAGPEVVMPLNRFEKMMGLDGNGRGKQINYYAAPNQSLDSEQALFEAMKRSKVVLGW